MLNLLLAFPSISSAEAPDWVLAATAEAALDTQARLASLDLAQVGIARVAMSPAAAPVTVRQPPGEFSWALTDRAGEYVEVPLDASQLALGAALATIGNVAVGPEVGMRSSTMFLRWVPLQIGGLEPEVAAQLASDPVYVDHAAGVAVGLAKSVVVPLLPTAERERLRRELALDLVELRSHWAGMPCPSDALADDGSTLRGFLCRHPETAAVWSAWALRGADLLGVDVRPLALELGAAWSHDRTPAATRARDVLKTLGGGG